MPALSKIENALRNTSAKDISDLIQNEPDTIFLIDYYFRLFQPEVAAKIINDPEFDRRACVELYDCQVIRFYRSNLYTEEREFFDSSLLDTYWKHVENERLIDIFQGLVSGTRTINPSAILILQELDISRLKFLRKGEQFQSHAMLELFKNMGEGVLNIIANNLDIFDFIYEISVDHKDEEYIKFLDDYTKFVVQLRIAQTMVEDGERMAKESGKIPLKDLVDMITMIPDEALEITLQLLLQRKFIDENTIRGISELRGSKLLDS